MFLESFGSATYTKGHFLSIPKAHDNDEKWNIIDPALGRLWTLNLRSYSFHSDFEIGQAGKWRHESRWSSEDIIRDWLLIALSGTEAYDNRKKTLYVLELLLVQEQRGHMHVLWFLSRNQQCFVEMSKSWTSRNFGNSLNALLLCRRYSATTIRVLIMWLLLFLMWEPLGDIMMGVMKLCKIKTILQLPFLYIIVCFNVLELHPWLHTPTSHLQSIP